MKEALLKRIEECGTPVTMPKDVILNKKQDRFITSNVYLLEEGICALTGL